MRFLDEFIKNPVKHPEEDLTTFTMRVIKAEHLLLAADICEKQKDRPWGSEWNMAAQSCQVALQVYAKELLAGKLA
jgi:hypothetical protein